MKVEVNSARELRIWLEQNHDSDESIWLVTFKKNAGDRYVSREEVLDELLCFGWIDGIRRKLDEKRTMQLISPRKVQHWAQSYKDRASRLIREGKMQESGLASIEESKRSGLWDFMNDVDALTKPEDLVKALKDRAGATEFFDAFPDSSKRFILRWIKLAKKPDTRARRIEKTAELAARNKRIPGS